MRYLYKFFLSVLYFCYQNKSETVFVIKLKF